MEQVFWQCGDRKILIAGNNNASGWIFIVFTGDLIDSILGLTNIKLCLPDFVINKDSAILPARQNSRKLIDNPWHFFAMPENNWGCAAGCCAAQGSKTYEHSVR
ncbi:hypothetical protein [Noviherbaspirillum saxi]|uniref:hypothetical protein n=1 Tax=Noviherbaspirillum saxi TaxID=2320863 RepID=UPI0011C48BB0|nr:hypothetical protein [Noviherbaspirillum saxi]